MTWQSSHGIKQNKQDWLRTETRKSSTVVIVSHIADTEHQMSDNEFKEINKVPKNVSKAVRQIALATTESKEIREAISLSCWLQRVVISLTTLG